MTGSHRNAVCGAFIAEKVSVQKQSQKVWPAFKLGGINLMAPQRGWRILVVNAVFNDDQQLRQGSIGHFVRYDGPLLVVNFSGQRLALRASDILCLGA